MRILVISTLSDLKEGLLPALREAGHDLVAVVPSTKKARARKDLAGFALFEGEPSCPGDWQRLIEGAEVVLHLAYSTPGAAECDFEPRHVLRADSVFQTVQAIAGIDSSPTMMLIALGKSSTPADPSDASVIRERLERITRSLDGSEVAHRFIDDSGATTILSALPGDAPTERTEQPVTSPPNSVTSTPRECLALSLESLLDDAKSSRTFELLHRLASDGVKVVLFTSSGMERILSHRDSLGFCRYVIMGDGAALLDMKTEEMVRTELLEPKLLEELVTAARSVSPRLSMYSERGMNVISDGSIPPLSEAAGILGLPENVSQGSLFDRPATRLFVQGPPASVGRVQQMYSEAWWKSGVIALLDYHPGLLGVLAPTADRSIALQRTETLLEVPRRSTVVFVSSPLDAGILEIYPQTWAYGPFSEVIGRHATRRFPPEASLFELLTEFLALQAGG